MYKLGLIEFIRQQDGSLAIGQRWNPDLIPRDDRSHISETLREIADQLDNDRFEINEEYRFRKAPKSVPA